MLCFLLLFPCFFEIISDILCFNIQLQINQGDHNCASTQRVVSKMANIGWVAERAIPLLKRDPQMGAKELQEELNYKYQIEIPYQTVYNGRQRAADKLFWLVG